LDHWITKKNGEEQAGVISACNSNLLYEVNASCGTNNGVEIPCRQGYEGLLMIIDKDRQRNFVGTAEREKRTLTNQQQISTQQVF